MMRMSRDGLRGWSAESLLTLVECPDGDSARLESMRAVWDRSCPVTGRVRGECWRSVSSSSGVRCAQT